jgi:hypothetical protein
VYGEWVVVYVVLEKQNAGARHKILQFSQSVFIEWQMLFAMVGFSAIPSSLVKGMSPYRIRICLKTVDFPDSPAPWGKEGYFSGGLPR